jgi:nitroimidazol reductase NimA-like FMN-containing flavoprotein (pyridoxamine 5'-phosphate oxidase superfamily)
MMLNGSGAMQTELTSAEIDELLRRQRIGRVGSAAVGHVEITPIVYGYDGLAVYGHSRFGRKIQYMRGNPEVCFEVEEIVDPMSWKVVVLHGRYEELSDAADRDRAMRFILAQGAGGRRSSATAVEHGDDLVVYRIRIASRSGRHEEGLGDA